MNNGFQQMWAEIKVYGTMHWKSTENIKTLKTLIQHDNIFWNCFFLFSYQMLTRNFKTNLQNGQNGGESVADWIYLTDKSILNKVYYQNWKLAWEGSVADKTFQYLR